MRLDLARLRAILAEADPYLRRGKVLELTATTARASLSGAFVGERCDLVGSGYTVPAEVVALRDGAAILVPFASTFGLTVQALASPSGRPMGVFCGESLLGRVVDPLGVPLDGLPAARGLVERALWAAPPPPLSRKAVENPLPTGVRAIDALTPLARGQRIGLLAPAGVGKSTLLGQIARGASADAVVVALCGERGREIQDFTTRELGPRRPQTAVFAAAADAPPMTRVACALAATSLAEHLRDQGRDVLLLVDSLTRVARAQREVGLASGEPPARRGFPPSVPHLLARLLERAANSARGTLTAVYTVLVEGDDPDDPIAEEARALLDGHLWLSRGLAERGRFPAIDPVRSISRVADRLRTPKELQAAQRLRSLIAAYESKRDLITLGAYVSGKDALVDEALRKLSSIEGFLSQPKNELSPWDTTGKKLLALSA
jgi:FliI/YscN family ATPase